MHATNPIQKHQLSKSEALSLNLKFKKVSLQLGSSKNTLAIQKLSPWFKFPGKQKHLTGQYYIYDPRLFKPRQPTSEARKLIGLDEDLILGSIRNPLYFGQSYHWTSALAPEHLKVTLTDKKLILKNLSSKSTLVTLA